MAEMERLLKIAADSSKFEGWNDALACIVGSTRKRYAFQALSEAELGMVAGGVKLPDGMPVKPEN